VQANSANNLAQAAYNAANSGSSSASAYTQANAANNLAQSAYNKANTGGTITGSVSITQDLTVSGNLSVLGTSTTITSTTLDIGDSLIYLANNNLTSDIVDIGIIGHYNDGANAHTGIFRDPTLKEWIFFKGYTPEVQSNNLINISHPSFSYANVYANWFKGNVLATSIAGITPNTTITAGNYTTTFDNYGKLTLQGAIVFADGSTQNTAYSNTYVISAYAQANASNTLAVSSYVQANAANTLASSAYASSNTNAAAITLIQGVDVSQNTRIAAVDAYANSGYGVANTKFSSSGGNITGDVSITGNLSAGALSINGGVF
jgi:hypothetical protein